MTWTDDEREFLKGLKDPAGIQDFLDSIGYDPDPGARSPRYVMIEKKAHCFEGAMFSASALRMIGFRPLIVDLGAYDDDDHVIAVFKGPHGWGAVGKSNFTTLRYREPVYRSLRELAMSYFDFYFNTKGEKTLRTYSVPLDLSEFDRIGWETTEGDLEIIGERLNRIRHYPVIEPEAVQGLRIVPGYLLESGLMGSDPSGLYEPE